MTEAEALANIGENICVASTVLGCVWLWLRYLNKNED